MDFYNKKILLVIHTGCLGGAERQGLGISKILTGEYNCIVNVLLTFSEEMSSEFENYAMECGVQNILHFGSPYLIFKREFTYRNLKRLVWSIKYLLKLRKELLLYQPDVIIPFLNFPSKVSYYLYKLLPSAKFTFWHQLGLDSNSLDIFESIAVNNIPCVIGNATNCLDMFKNIYIVNPEKLFVLPQYISLEYIEADKDLLRMKYSIPKESLVIGMIAHYREEKYHDLVLDVFNKLAIKYDTIHLVFLGNIENQIYAQEKYSQLSKNILENKTSNRISLLSGFKVQDILGLLDIGVLMSRIEGMPNAVMEYMLYGLPVVTTNHPGCIELLKDSSFLIENNEGSLYDALEKLIISEELRVSEGTLNFNKIKSYDMDSYLVKMNLIINKALKI